MTFGLELRKEREAAGLSRGELRLRILRFFDKAPSVSTIRDVENNGKIIPQARNVAKYARVLAALSKYIGTKRNIP